MSDQPNTHSQNDKNAGYEKSDVNLAMITGAGIVTIVIIVALLIFVNEYFIYFKEQVVQETVLAPQAVEIRDLRAKEAQALHSYKVLDAENGVYRIPIDRAMELMAQESFESQLDESSQN